MRKYDGGGAFPSEQHEINNGEWNQTFERGLSLRDYFAAKAMQSIIAKSPFQSDPDSFEVYNKTAIGAYDYADAMLKVREENNE